MVQTQPSVELRLHDRPSFRNSTYHTFEACWYSSLIPYRSDICKIILAIILPPLGVFLERGCGSDLLINILLTILGYIPGIIHALYVSPRRICLGARFAPQAHLLLTHC